MSKYSGIKVLCVTLCLLIIVAEIATAAPSYADYENSIRDLYDLLMQKEALEEQLGAHHVSRKSNRSPSLRLRFGRRSDPNMLPASAYILSSQDTDHGDN